MTSHLFWNRVANVTQRIGSAGILSDPLIVEIDIPCNRIKNDILENRAVSLSTCIDFGFRSRRKPDHLGITTVLYVENAVLSPAVLIIPY